MGGVREGACDVVCPLSLSSPGHPCTVGTLFHLVRTGTEHASNGDCLELSRCPSRAAQALPPAVPDAIGDVVVSALGLRFYASLRRHDFGTY